MLPLHSHLLNHPTISPPHIFLVGLFFFYIKYVVILEFYFISKVN